MPPSWDLGECWPRMHFGTLEGEVFGVITIKLMLIINDRELRIAKQMLWGVVSH